MGLVNSARAIDNIFKLLTAGKLVPHVIEPLFKPREQ